MIPEFCNLVFSPILEPSDETLVFILYFDIWPEVGMHHQLNEKARQYLRQAEHCYRLAEQCADRLRAAHLNVLGDDFLNKAARIEEKPRTTVRELDLQSGQAPRIGH